VCIFPHSQENVIIIITLLTAWKVVLGRSGDTGGRLPRDGGRERLNRGRGRGHPVDESSWDPAGPESGPDLIHAH
jgi:hypothetical protein